MQHIHLWLFFVVQLAPLAFGFGFWSVSYIYTLFLCFLSAAAAYFLHKSSVRIRNEVVPHSARMLPRLPPSDLLIYFVPALILMYYAVNPIGITERSLLVKETGHYNTTHESFVSVQLDYILMMASSLFCSLYLFKRRSVFLILASLISSYLLVVTGTRWYWLLSLAPLIVFLILRSTPLKMLSYFLVLLSLSVTVGLVRAGGSLDGLRMLLAWDIPSFASHRIVNDYDWTAFNILSFVYGQLLILIPRFLWSNKPADYVVESFMISEIGDAYDIGASILPGFVGSAWLYAGAVGVVLFVGLYAYVGFKIWVRILSSHAPMRFAILSMGFVGLLLQLRGFAVGYFFPAVYGYILYVLLISQRALVGK